jgi:flagellar biogenesis protein FliO
MSLIAAVLCLFGIIGLIFAIIYTVLRMTHIHPDNPDK